MPDLNLGTPLSSGGGVGYSVSVRFQVSTDTDMTHIQHYYDSTSPWPNKVYLYNVTTSAVEMTLGPAPITWVGTSPGIYEHELAVPQLVEYGSVYALTCYYESVGAKQWHGPVTGAPDPPLSLGSRYYVAADNPNPGTISSVYPTWGFGPVVHGGAPGNPPTDPDPNVGTVHEIARWLDHDDPYLYPNSLAKIAHDQLTSVSALIDAIKAKTDYLPFPLNLLTDIWLADLKATNEQTLTILANIDTHVIGASGGGGSAFYGPNGTQVAEGVETLLAGQGVPPDMSLLREQLTLSPDLTDTTRWTSSGQLVSAGDDFANFGADVYLVTFTSIPANQPQHALPGSQVWVPRLSWCAPLRNGMALERRFLDFRDNMVTADGLYMGGLLVYAGPGVAYTVDGLVLDRP